MFLFATVAKIYEFIIMEIIYNRPEEKRLRNPEEGLLIPFSPSVCTHETTREAPDGLS
jgi:hypothetical protein